MVSNQCESNYATISGKVASRPVFSHDVYGEGFYYFFVDVKRLSDSFDRIPVMISERLVSPAECSIGRSIMIDGQFRSYNQNTYSKSRLMLMVFAREVVLDYVAKDEYFDDTVDEAGDSADGPHDKNYIELYGFICKPPIYRKTPFNREIADLLLAVNRSYNKSDYIPCISWGRNARYCSRRAVGDKVKVIGRIQSRIYQKKLPDGTVEDRVAYEVSIIRLELLKAFEQTRRSFDESESVSKLF